MRLIGYFDECNNPVITTLKEKDFEWLECAGMRLIWESEYKFGEWPDYKESAKMAKQI